ncbi:hypothetical protein ACIBKZ_24235 [Streptomyces sp. NPDC050421]|uniref:hypothetical protein n=1 Tax=unclassified Streptomyces TaxID=2593676 RepID=UPI00378B19FB
MSIELIVACLSGAVALGSIALSGRGARRQALLAAQLEYSSAQRSQHERRQDLMSGYRDPLLMAAFDLQSRLENITDRQRGFLTTHYLEGTPRDRAYARTSTLFVFAEYLCWVEIIRRRIRFLDLGADTHNRIVVDLLLRTRAKLASDAHDSCLLLYRAEQRAIGEIMTTEDGDACIGYAEFCRRLDTDPVFTDWFARLDEDIEELASRTTASSRLTGLRTLLLELVACLDPHKVHFPAEHLLLRPRHPSAAALPLDEDRT